MMMTPAPPTWTHRAPEFPLPPWPEAFRVVEHAVRNVSDRRGAAVDCIVIHDTETLSVASVLHHFDNPEAQASAHFLIDRDGTTYALVPIEKKAWHAGVSQLGTRKDVNQFSIGIELMDVDQADVVPPITYTDAQLTTLLALTIDLVTRYVIPLERIVGHADVALPPGRKTDPGRDFPWIDFRAAVDYHAARRRA